jgi:hypothetical protein
VTVSLTVGVLAAPVVSNVSADQTTLKLGCKKPILKPAIQKLVIDSVPRVVQALLE